MLLLLTCPYPWQVKTNINKQFRPDGSGDYTAEYLQHLLMSIRLRRYKNKDELPSGTLTRWQYGLGQVDFKDNKNIYLYVLVKAIFFGS